MKVAFILIILPFILSLDNGLGKTPQMGFNAWNKFNCDINEDIMRRMADAMVETGLAELGYTYINLDDCWQYSRDETGRIQEDKRTFPSGMKALADYIHSKGLKFGLYSDAGTLTCGLRPGSLGYEDIDAKVYAEWGVDYLKYDNCSSEGLPSKPRYEKMRDALLNTGRPIFFSMCSWGTEEVWTWAKDVGNSWRTTGDIVNTWFSFLNNLDRQFGLEGYAGPGGWNDPDMLEVGNGGLNAHQGQAHFALWALLKAPLLLGNDLSNIDKVTFEIISNKEIIAINQDPLGKQGKRISRKWTLTGYLEVYAGELIDGWAVILFNRAWYKQNITFNFSDIGRTKGCLRDLVKHKDLGMFEGTYTAKVEHQSAIVLKVTDCPNEYEI
jgi:alpha-galactosidase